MSNFDWVKARAKCSFPAMFQDLREALDSDVKSVNALERPNVSFAMRQLTSKKIIVSRTRDFAGVPQGDGVVFELLENEIVAKHLSNGNQFLSAKPILSADGECLLKVSQGVEPVQLWQFNQMALDGLFFGF